MPDTDAARTLAVTIDVEPAAAAALTDTATRARVGRLVSQMLGSPSIDGLFAAMDALRADAHRRGLTDAVIDQELAAYNDERRGGGPGPPPA